MDSIKIGKKDYDLYLGFDFIRELDKRHPEETQGITFGFGVGMTLINLTQRSPLGVLDFIQAATVTEKQKPSVKDIEALFTEWQKEGKTEEMYMGFIKQLEDSPLTAPTLAAFRQYM